MICFCASSSELCASHELHFTFRVQCFRLKKTFSRNGTNRARTYDPLLVRQMLSQLSYDPICSSVSQPTSLLYNHLLTNVNCFFHFFALFFTISRSFHSIPLNDTGCVGGLWKKNRLDSSCANHSEEPFGAKIVSAMASTIFKSPLHCAT